MKITIAEVTFIAYSIVQSLKYNEALLTKADISNHLTSVSKSTHRVMYYYFCSSVFRHKHTQLEKPLGIVPSH